MKKYLINVLALVVSIVLCNGAFAAGGINTGKGAVPFGKNTRYEHGVMPTNLPAGGTYGQAQKAADAYNTWKSLFVESCSSGGYRVKFDETQYTVSEGIAYGMLLSVYADDKDLFDGLWTYYKKWSNGNGVMHWKINGCNGVNQSNGATDAELDVAMSLVIATEQWGSSYSNDAKAMIQRIKQYEMHGNGQTLNGDAWGNTNSCRNPSYFAPAYYKEFAKVDAGNSSFWSGSAITASNDILLANRNATSGLVSNWCSDNGQENTCGNTGSGANGYGADACRNPWRMAVDILWHGDNASSAAKDICGKLIKFVNGNEAQMKGPHSNRNVSSCASGSYMNGSYTTFALPPMTSSSAQSSLNKCYNSVANLTDDGAYFNMTIRCVSLFVLTGNFWAPGASGFVFPPSVLTAEAVGDNKSASIELSMNKDMKSGSGSASNFTVYYNGNAQSGIISGVSISGSKVTLQLSTAPQPGQTITLSYDGKGSINSSENAAMEAFTKMEVLNMLAGNETIIDDVNDGNEFNNLGGIWFSFDDKSNFNSKCTHPDMKRGNGHGSSSTIAPLSGNGVPFEISKTGYDNSGYCIYAKFTLGEGYVPNDGGGCAQWHNPAFVGIGTYMHKDNESVVDWSKGTGVTFYYKGPACSFQVVTTDVTDGGFHFWSIDECKSWTKITKTFDNLDQPTSWCAKVTFNPKHVQKLQWQWESSVIGAETTGEIYIDEVHVLGMPPVELTGLEIQPVSNADLADDDCANNIDPLKIPIAEGNVGDTCYLETEPTPGNATYPVAFWSSSDEDIVTVDYRGRVLGVGYGEATITARSKMHQNVSATYTVKVPAPKTNPTAIDFEEESYEVSVGGQATIIPKFTPSITTETGLTWKSSDVSIATVSSSGVVTGISTGEVTITATSSAEGCTNVKKSVTVTVKGKPLTSITANKESVKIPVGGTETISLTFDPEDADDLSVEWSTSDATVATVNNGVISSVGAGTCTITATSKGTPTVKAEIAVEVENVCVTSITLKQSEMNLDLNSKDDFIVEVDTYETNYETTPTFTFASSNTSVVRIDSEGFLILRGEGTSTITVTADDACKEAATCEVTVSIANVSVTGVSLDKTTASLAVGETVTLKETVAPADATDKTVSWSSSDEKVATVAEGVVTAVAAGSATITVTTTDGSKTATCVVTVTVPITGVALDKKTATLVEGETLDLVATVSPDNATNKAVSWASDKTDVAIVNGTGTVTAKTPGTATITVTTTDGSKTATCVVTVEKKIILPTSISMAASLGFVDGGESQSLNASVLPSDADNKKIIWSSSDESVATVADGVVSPVGVGNCVITAKCEADETVTATCEVAVTANTVDVTGVTLAPITLSMTEGDEENLTVTVTPSDATNQKVSWSSSDEKVATVANGVVKAVAEGNAIITVTTEDGEFTATCSVSVKAATVSVEGVTLDKTAETLVEKNTLQLTATVAPANATNKVVAWSSSNENVATVSATGLVTAVAAGDATITVTTEDGKFTATCKITVEAATIAVTGVTIDKSTLELMVGNEVQLTATVSPADASNTNVTWSSNNESAVSVDQTGKITAKAAGDAVVTVTTEDGSKTATCTITVSEEPVAVTVTEVVLNSTELTLKVNGSKGLTATVNYSDGTSSKKEAVVWTSDNPDVADVDDGWIDAFAEGEATITASFEGKSATCVVTVISNVTTVAVTGVTLNETAVSVAKNASLTLVATVLPTNATNKNITWSSSNENVATVDGGVLTIKSVGSTTITVTTEDGSKTATCDVTVTDILATNVIIDNSLSLTIGETGTISATVLPKDASQSVTWASDNESVATVDASGKVTAVSAGTANITATSTDGTNLTSDPCVVTVSNVSISKVVLDKSSMVLRVGSTATLNASIEPTNATNKELIWSSSKDFATVSNGVVTAVAVGSTTITATSEEDAYIYDECKVEVVDASLLQAEITTATSTLNAAVEGSEIGQYKIGSKTTFQSAVTKAQTVFDNANSSQTEIDAALATLQLAEKTFAKAINANETMIFDADMEQENMTYMATYWFSFNDSEPGGSSVITPLSSEAEPFTMSTPGANGSGKAAMMEYTLNGSKDLGYNAFVGMGMNFKEPAGKPFDMTGSKGISFQMKNDSPVYFEVEQTDITDACDFYIYLPVHSNWELIELSWSDLAQYSWGVQVTWDLTKLTKCQWKVQEADGTTGQVWVDDVKVLGALDLPEILNRTPLYTAIAEAQEFLDESTIGTADGNYPQSAATALESAIATAQAVVDSKTIEHQTEIEAAVIEMNAALEVFKNSVISLAPVDFSALEAKIQTANNYYTTSEEGNEEGKYLSGSKATLKTAIDAATVVYNTSTSTQVEVNAATTKLASAIETFLASKYVPGVVNKSMLASTIAEANTLYSSAVEGVSKGNYPVGSKAELYSAITSAQVVNMSTTATQDGVDAAVLALQSAIATFQSLVITVDKSLLISTINMANTSLAKSDGNTGTEPGQYPAEAVATFTSAIGDAATIRDNVSAKQASVDAAVSMLQEAITVFEASVIPGAVNIKDLEVLIVEADDLINNTFEPSRYLLPYIELVNCKSSAKTEVAKTSHVASDVETLIERLSAAIEAYKAAKKANPEEIDAIEDVEVVALSAYPNPCKNSIKISAGKEIATIAVVNVAGSTQFVVEVGNNEIVVALSSIKAGFYFANVTYADGTVETIRFVKQ